MFKSRLAPVAALLLAGAAPLVAQPAANPPAANPNAQPARAAAGKARFGTWGVDLAARDTSVKPGDDFWRFANNGWFKANPIPADRTAYGVSVLLAEELEQQQRAIL